MRPGHWRLTQTLTPFPGFWAFLEHTSRKVRIRVFGFLRHKLRFEQNVGQRYFGFGFSKVFSKKQRKKLQYISLPRRKPFVCSLSHEGAPHGPQRSPLPVVPVRLGPSLWLCRVFLCVQRFSTTHWLPRLSPWGWRCMRLKSGLFFLSVFGLQKVNKFCPDSHRLSCLAVWSSLIFNFEIDNGAFFRFSV